MKFTGYDGFLGFIKYLNMIKHLSIDEIGKDNYNCLFEATNRIAIVGIMMPRLSENKNDIEMDMITSINSILGSCCEMQDLWEKHLECIDKDKMKTLFLNALELSAGIENPQHQFFNSDFQKKIWDLAFSPSWEVLQFMFWGISNMWINQGDFSGGKSILTILENLQAKLEDNSLDDTDDDEIFRDERPKPSTDIPMRNKLKNNGSEPPIPYF